MYIYHNPNLDPYFNLALEEYLLRHTPHNYILIWRSNPSVVVGKHQNLQAELRQAVLAETGILPARRLSGGGTVFHDWQNLNFSFLKTGEMGRLVDFKQFIGPIAHFMQQQGIPATLSERNDILVLGLKVSGNAEHVYKNRVLHHGTLLFSSDLDLLRAALRPASDAFSGRAVQSVRKPVTQIAPYFEQGDLTEFTERLIAFLTLQFDCAPFVPDTALLAQVEALAQVKYATPEWIFDYSPAFKQQCSYFGCAVELEVQKGRILQINVLQDASGIQQDLATFLGQRMELNTLYSLCRDSQQREQVREWFL